jgi:hypothetical protein
MNLACQYFQTNISKIPKLTKEWKAVLDDFLAFPSDSNKANMLKMKSSIPEYINSFKEEYNEQIYQFFEEFFELKREQIEKLVNISPITGRVILDSKDIFSKDTIYLINGKQLPLIVVSVLGSLHLEHEDDIVDVEMNELKEVFSFIRIKKGIRSIEAQKLETAGTIIANNTPDLEKESYPSLTSLVGVDSNSKSFFAPSLKNVSKSIFLYRATEIDLRSLEEMKEQLTFTIAEEVNLPSLRIIGDRFAAYNAKTVRCPQLSTAKQLLFFAAEEMDFSHLQSCDVLYIQSLPIENFKKAFPELQTIRGDVYVGNIKDREYLESLLAEEKVTLLGKVKVYED